MNEHPLELLGRYFEGEVNASEAASLGEALVADPALRDLFAAIALQRRLALRTADPATQSTNPPTRDRARTSARLALAASLLLAAGAFAIVSLLLNNRQSPIDHPQSPPLPLASVTDILDGTLTIDDQLAATGGDYAGRSVSLDAGEAEFMLASRVVVRLRGPSELTIHDRMSATLTRGRAGFTCPPGAKGYTVHLPDGARVVDLGTEFLVFVGDDGSSGVEVLDGLVEVHTPTGRAAQLAAPAEARVVAGELRVNLVRNGGFDRGAPEQGFAFGPPQEWTVHAPSGELGLQRIEGNPALYWNEPDGTLAQDGLATIEADGHIVALSARVLAVNVGAFDVTAQLTLDGEPIPHAAVTHAAVDHAGTAREIQLRYVTQPQDVGRSLGLRFGFRVDRPAVQANLDDVRVEIHAPTPSDTHDHSRLDGPAENGDE